MVAMMVSGSMMTKIGRGIIVTVRLLMTMVVLVMVKVETDRLKAVLCAVRQWLRFQLHREAGAAKNQSLIQFSKAKSLILKFLPGRVGE